MFQSDSEQDFEVTPPQCPIQERGCTPNTGEEKVDSSIEAIVKEIQPLNQNKSVLKNKINQRNHVSRTIYQSHFLEHILFLLGNRCVNCERHMSHSSRKIVNGHTVILQEFQENGGPIINIDEIIQCQFGHQPLTAYEKGGWTLNFLKDTLSFYGFEIHEKKVKKGCHKALALKGTLITSILVPERYITLLVNSGIPIFDSRITDQGIEQFARKLRFGYGCNQIP
ncbi:hypothetical protein EDI_333110 [Entamoeba dispar SAW760]|uniref:Uncharacterized protein n=1 Tax=Entamoeba dispar (strain ATCC PRA-260 / SAW760) TaxID=370354 RepID=B0EDT1_ENTDS|nr:uncharacterized protein EDI_333110 [Entamoeba dispar SAW760]EDR27314.1 hypothetical protein EDI_333110 [Entamoeba dispar SAW760]|eukprot:EDR27314.1 hypothetical protein EDI_333110 [Entamoeba dispar SAW760]